LIEDNLSLEKNGKSQGFYDEGRPDDRLAEEERQKT